MKKLFPLILLLACHTVTADTVGFSLGAYSWQTKASGGITTPGIDLIDLSISSFDTDTDSNNVYFLEVTHSIPALPNIKIAHSSLQTRGYNGKYVYGPNVFDIGLGIIDLTHTDITGFYQVLDTFVSIDVGLSVRIFDGELGLYNVSLNGSPLNSAASPLDSVLPLLYTRINAQLPAGFSLEAESNIGSTGDESGVDLSFMAKYQSPIGLGAAAGYRHFNADLSSDVSYYGQKEELEADISFKGPVFYIFYSF